MYLNQLRVEELDFRKQEVDMLQSSLDSIVLRPVRQLDLIVHGRGVAANDGLLGRGRCSLALRVGPGYPDALPFRPHRDRRDGTSH